jgi:hypothetical protein
MDAEQLTAGSGDALTADTITVPLVIRGRVIEDDIVSYDARRGGITFQSPDVGRRIDELVLRDPAALSDLYTLSLDEIADFLDELGRRLSPATNPHMARALEIAQAVSGLSRAMLGGVYDAMRGVLRRDRVLELAEANVGIDYLEGWVPRRLEDRVVEVRAFGARTVHVIAGNSPVCAVHAVLTNAVLRSDAIIKTPSNDPFTASAIALTMAEMAPEHPLTRHLSVAYWKGGDSELERRLYRPTHVEKVVAWGGMASMQHIRAHLGPGLDLIALDPSSAPRSSAPPRWLTRRRCARPLAGSRATSRRSTRRGA